MARRMVTMQASDVMKTPVRSVRPDLSLIDLERTFGEARQGGFPVIDEDSRLVGVVSRADIVRQLATEQSYAEYESDYYREQKGYGDFEPDEPLSQVAARAGGRLEGRVVSDVMSRLPVTVASSTPIQDVARIFTERGIHRVPVVDLQGGHKELVGILTTMDIARAVVEGKLVPSR
jgi:CBS domain-containing protein